MPFFDLAARLEDILAAIDDVEAFTAGKSFDDDMEEPMLRPAVERSIEIVSDASRQVPEDLKTGHPEIRWRRIAGIGNLLRHGCKTIDDHEMWDIVVRDLASLKAVTEQLLRDVEPKGTP
jgi:uncharacterized protein with HEPN domain